MTWYTPRQQALIQAAAKKTYALPQQPFLAKTVQTWITHLSPTDDPADYFMHPKAVPFLLFPWWLEGSLKAQVDETFQDALIFSSMNAYYHTRLVDNMMDGDTDDSPKLMALSSVFHLNFQTPYQQFFSAGHPFWEFFQQIWLEQAQAAWRDGHLTEIHQAEFEQVVSQKVCGMKIPLAAVCHYYDRLDLLPHWVKIADLFGQWHMLFHDLFDWHKDLEHQNLTYFLSTAQQKKAPEESVTAWVIHTGIRWGLDQLKNWLDELEALAQITSNLDLSTYLQDRRTMLLQQEEKMTKGLQFLAQLTKVEQ